MRYGPSHSMWIGNCFPLKASPSVGLTTSSLGYMQLLHRFNFAATFSLAHSSRILLSFEPTFTVRVKLALLSPCLKWPQCAWWIIASLRDLLLIT